METIFSFDLATDRFSMGSSEPLGEPSAEYMQTKESDIVVIDDEDEIDVAAVSPAPGIGHGGNTIANVPSGFCPSKKRKRSLLGVEGVVAITCMTEAVKAVVTAIITASPPDVHPALYDTVMGAKDYILDTLMVALSHLFDNRAMGNNFVHMVEDQRNICLRTYLAKCSACSLIMEMVVVVYA
uniref:Uncharacterized protein n=1 Tax=Avena sativa TaxID=4498 RepID=A0ACD5YA40_AVESA